MLVVAVLSMPTLVGYRWVYQPLLRRLASGDFRVQIETVEIAWLKPIALRGITLSQVDSTPLITVKSIRSPRGLLSYLYHGRNLGRIEIDEPVVDVRLVEDGSNLHRFLQAISPTSEVGKLLPKRKPPAFDLDVGIHGMSAILHPVSSMKSNENTALLVIPPFDSEIVYRNSDAESFLEIKPTQVLDRVTLTPELMQMGLELAVPLLAKSAWFDGQVSLRIESMRIPLDVPSEMRGQLALQMHRVRSGPTSPQILRLIDFGAQLMKRESAHELVFVDQSSVEIQIADRRVHHAGLRAGVPQIDPRLQISTSGSVGLEDHSLEILLGLPVPVEYLALRPQIKQLGVPEIHLAIGGTLEHPDVDWKKMRYESSDLLELIGGLVEADAPGTAALLNTLSGVAEGKTDAAIAAGVDLLEQFLENRRSRRANSQKPSQTENNPGDSDEQAENERRSRPILDGLRKRLWGREP
jgi:hypothetical protein